MDIAIALLITNYKNAMANIFQENQRVRRTQGFIKDILLILQTIPAVLLRKGAR